MGAKSGEADCTGPRVLLLCMPFGHIRFPALGVSLLKAGLAAQGVGCDVRYHSIDCVDQYMVGGSRRRFDDYNALGNIWSYYHAAEACFARLVSPVKEAECRALIAAVEDASIREQLEHLWANAERFVENCVAEIDGNDRDVVGFSSTFNQNLASLALARRLKQRWPHLAIVFGGPNAEGPMGEELLRQFPFVGYVVSGEGDVALPALVHALRSGDDPGRIPGVRTRGADRRIVGGGSHTFAGMNDLAYPDFDDFFAQLDGTWIAMAPQLAHRRTLPFESSRGCWWGEKHHCTFCGLNGHGMPFRAKSAKRLVDEIEHLQRRYRPTRLAATDNIMDYRYFESLLPELAARALPITFSFDVKANMRRSQARALARAGVHEVEAGIESLSTAALKRMRKGSTMLQNVLTMRLAREYDIRLNWQHLIGFPGETFDDYAHIPHLLPRIWHLEAPSSEDTGEISLQRYSPYHTNPAAFGIARVRPARSYAAIYDVDEAALANLAYRFEFDFAPDMAGDLAKIRDTLSGAFRMWRRRDAEGADLAVFTGEAQGLVLDTREEHPRIVELDTVAVAALAAADEVTGRDRLEEAACAASRDPAVSSDAAARCPRGLLMSAAREWARRGVAHRRIVWRGEAGHVIDALIDCGLILAEGPGCVALAVPRRADVLRSILERLGTGEPGEPPQGRSPYHAPVSA